MILVEPTDVQLDNQLERQIAQAEANGESAEFISALIADNEKKKSNQVAGRWGNKKTEETHDERYKREKKEKEEKEKRKFTGSNHVTTDELTKANKSVWGTDDEDMIPILQDIYGEDFEITNASKWGQSLRIENKKDGTSTVIDVNTPAGMYEEHLDKWHGKLTAFIDEQNNKPEDLEAVTEWTKKKEINTSLNGAWEIGEEDAAIEIIDKNIEDWNDQPERYTTEEAFKDTGGRTGDWHAVWRGKGAPSSIHTNAAAGLDKTQTIVSDIKDATAIEIRAMRDEKEDGFGTEFTIDWNRDGEDLYERVFERINSNPNSDYLLPRDQFDKLTGGGGGATFLQAEIANHNDIFESEVGDRRLLNVERDEKFQSDQEAILTQDLTEGEKAKVPLVAKEQALSKKLNEIEAELDNSQLSDSDRRDLENQLQALNTEYETNRKAIDANAKEHGSWIGWSDKSVDELRELFYEKGVSKEGAYTKLKAQREADAYIAANSGKGKAIERIMHETGMTEQEAVQRWYKDLELENQVIRENGMERTVSVDLNKMDSTSRAAVVSYLTNRAEGVTADEQALIDLFSGGSLYFQEARFDIPVSTFVDGTVESQEYEGRKTLGMDARDFEGWLDKSKRWLGNTDWGLDEKDLDKISQYEHEVDENKGKRKAAYDAAYLSFDPASIRKTSTSRGGSVFGDTGEGAVGKTLDVVGTGLNPLFWNNIVDKGSRAIETQWLDYSEAEAIESTADFYGNMGGFSARDRLSTLQKAAADMNEEYAEEIASGKMDGIFFNPKQLEVFEATMAEGVSDGVGEFVPTLIELAAITIATEGTMTALGVTRYLNGLKNGYKIVNGVKKFKKGGATLWDTAKYHMAHVAIEEAKMQVAGFQMTSGAAFYTGGQLGGRFLVPSKIIGLASKRMGNAFSAIDPIAAKTIGAGVIGAGSGEIAGITELAWESYVKGDTDFATGFNNLYGDMDEVEKRLITNSFVFGIAGNMGKGRLKKQDFIFSKKGKAAHTKAVTEKMVAKRKGEIRDSSVIQESQSKLDEAKAELEQNEKNKEDRSITMPEYELTKEVLEAEIKELEQKIETDVDNTYTELEMQRLGIGGSKGLGGRSKQVWESMSEGTRGRYTEFEKTQSAVESWFSWSQMTDKIEPYIWKDGKEIENPEFQKNFKDVVIAPINNMLKLSWKGESKDFKPLTVEFFNKAEAKRHLGSGVADFNPETNVLRFNMTEMRGGQGSAYTNHELVHAALSQVFKGKDGARGKYLFQNNIKGIFEKAFGPEYGKDIEAKVREKYGDKDLKEGELDKKLQEEYIANLAEYITNPKIYHTKVANTFFKEISAEFKSMVEENFGGNKRVSEWLRPKTTKDIVNLLGRMGNDIRGGYSVSQKFKWLTQLDKLEDASLLGVEFTDKLGSNTFQSQKLSKDLQENSVALNEKKARKKELMDMNKGEGFRYTDIQKAELKNLIPEIKELEAREGELEGGLKRHDETQLTVDRFKETLEAQSIAEERSAEKLKEEIAELDKEKLGEDKYNFEVLELERKYTVSKREDRLIAKMMDLQGGYINELKSKYRPTKGSDLTREEFDKEVMFEVGELMRTYDKFKNDSFAPYLKQFLPKRFQGILERKGVDLGASMATKSLDRMRDELGFDIAAPEDVGFNLDLSPGGEAIKTAAGVRLVKAGVTGKLRRGVIPLSETAIKDIEAKAKKQELSLDKEYKDAPDIAAPHIKKLVYPDAKSEKSYIDSKGKKHNDYGKDPQKRANFIANYLEAVNVSPRKNISDKKGVKTNAPKTLMNRKRPGEKGMRPVYFQDMIGADGKPVTVKKAETGEWVKGEKVKGTGAKTGSILKERIEMTPEQFLAEAGIIDNRTPEQKKKAKEIALKEKLSPDMVKFMLDHGNVDISAVQRKALDAKGKETSIAYDRGLPEVQKQLINELSQGTSVQAIDAVKTSSPEFQALDNAAQLIETVNSGKSPLLASRGLSKNLSEIFNIPEKLAKERFGNWALGYGIENPTKKDIAIQDYLSKTFDSTNLKASVIKMHEDAVMSHVNRKGIESAKDWVLQQELEGNMPKDVLAAMKGTTKGTVGKKSKGFNNPDLIEGKKYSTIDYENIVEHFEVAKDYLEMLPPGLSEGLLRNLPADVLEGRRGTDTLIKTFSKEFNIDKVEGRKIINEWRAGNLGEGNFKKYLDAPKNQHTDIIRKVGDKWVEVPFSDPIFSMTAESRRNVGSRMHEAFKGIDFKGLAPASRLGAAYGKANLLQEQGKLEEAREVLQKAFTAADGKAKKALYNGTGLVMERLIKEATEKGTAEKDKALRFLFRLAKANTNLVEGERALTDNRFFYEGEAPGSRDALSLEIQEKLGTSRETADKRARKAKVEHSLVSLIASYQKASLAAQGKWSGEGKNMASEYIGIFDIDARLALVDKAATSTNPAALSRMTMLGKELRNYSEYIDGEFTGRKLDDVLVSEVMSEIVDMGMTSREIKQPYLRDAIAEYKSTLGSQASKLKIRNAIKNKANEIKLNKNLEEALSSTVRSEGLSKGEKLDLMKDIDKATANGRRRSAKRKGMSTWDFDDTLAHTKSDVLFTAPDGKKGKLNAEQFAKKGSEMLEQGYKFDFSEFNKVTGGEPGPFLEKALERAKKFGTKDQFILTARAQEAAPAIREFLKSQGLDISLENIVGLGNSAPEAKARWMLKKFAEGYNDMYFADDAMQNVKAVKNVLSQLDIKSNVQQARRLQSEGLSKGINEMIERKSGIDAIKEFSTAKGKMLGRRRWTKSLVAPGAQDFMGLAQNFLGKGKQGNADRAFFEKNMVNPFARATKEMNEARQRSSEDMKRLYKDIPSVKKKLNKTLENSAFTYDQAIRAHLWEKAGHEIPGLSAKDLKQMTDVVRKDAELLAFADGLQAIGKGEYVKPGEHWITETIVSDLFNLNNKANRSKFLAEWIENKNIIFSEKNLNKIEATQGTKFREALEDMLYRMETGSNRPRGANRLANAHMNFINGSVGATMFLNMRSALLQTISATNYINWAENNPLKAAARFANQKQYWKDFSMIWNSPMLKQRRAGLEYNVQEAELAAAVAGQKNKAKAAMAYLIKKGFTPTQLADSFAIAAGGSTYYRNRLRMYEKQGLKKTEAMEKAWLDFQELTETNQQSSRADLISQQQASTLGRTILAWANTPMQYMRIQEKAFRDIANGRGDFKSNISKIAYYGVIQSIIFASLQNALFSYGLDEEEDMDEEGFAKRIDRITNTVIDGQLRGMGAGGAAVAAIKNTILEFQKQELKAEDDSWFSQPDHTKTILQLTSYSPVLGSKLRKLYSASQTWNYNRDVISEMGWDINNPAIEAGANVIEATTNIPVARLVRKIDNLKEVADSENQNWQRIAHLVGYSSWDIGTEDEELEKVKEEVKGKRKDKKQSDENKAAQESFIEDQKREREEGKKTTCAAVNRAGKRCSIKPVGNGTFCTIHQEVKQNTTGKKTQCTHVKSDGKRCKMKTTSKSGKCYYHD